MNRNTVRVPEFVTPQFLARRYCVHPKTIRRWIKNKWIRARPTRANKKGQPSGFRITRDEVRFLDGKEGPGADTHLDHCPRPYLKERGVKL